LSVDPVTGKGSGYNGPERRKPPVTAGEKDTSDKSADLPPDLSEGGQHECRVIEKYLKMKIVELEKTVTMQKKIEEALTIERKRLFSLLNNLPAYVYLHSSDYSIPFFKQIL